MDCVFCAKLNRIFSVALVQDDRDKAASSLWWDFLRYELRPISKGHVRGWAPEYGVAPDEKVIMEIMKLCSGRNQLF